MGDRLMALGPVALVLLNIVLGVAQLLAFAEGVDVWLGWNIFGAVLVFFILSMIPFGTIGTTIVAYIGATKGWGWEWWQAVLLIAPYLILGIVMSAAGGIAGALSRSRRAA
ncbi:MAG: hypothetical protein J0M36_12030 [Caulobacterales bacterium]|nr:hypothetical protein [Caulobacterales bacterium]